MQPKKIIVCDPSAYLCNTSKLTPPSSKTLTTHQKTTRADMAKDRKAFENKIIIESDAVNTEVELRTRELLRLRDEKQQEQEAEENRQVSVEQ